MKTDSIFPVRLLSPFAIDSRNLRNAVFEIFCISQFRADKRDDPRCLEEFQVKKIQIEKVKRIVARDGDSREISLLSTLKIGEIKRSKARGTKIFKSRADGENGKALSFSSAPRLTKDY